MNEFYVRLYEKAEAMFTVLAPAAYVLIVVALWTGVSGGNRSATMYLRAIVQAIVIVLLLSQFTPWIKEGETVVHSLVHDTLQADPGKVYDKYKAMTESSSDEAEGGFWHTVFNLSEKELFKALITAMLWMLQFVAKTIVFLAYVVYKAVLAFAIAASPIFIGFLSVRTLSSIGVRFLLGTVGFLLWPLGWGFASLVTDTLLEVMSQESFVSATGLEELKNLLAVGAAGLWIIFSTLAAPLVIQKMITEGSNAGAAFLQGGWRATRAGMQSAATAGASLAATGVGAPLAVAGAAGTGALAFGSSSLSGSGYSSIGELAGNAARWRQSQNASSSSPSYDATDPANDKKAAALVGQSRNPNSKRRAS